MVIMESCVPPGFRFHPTDEELVGYYLRKKVASQKIDLDVIRDVDLYRIEPWDLQEHCRIGYEEQSDWYFFSYKDRKYPTGTRTNRATMTGFWKATGRDKAVRDKARLIGMRKTLVFYRGRAPNGQKSDWIVHEYRLDAEENGRPQEEGWVVCRAFKKRTTHPPRSIIGAWDNAAATSAILQYSSRFTDQLPQLESPPLQNQSSQLLATASAAEGEEEEDRAAVTTDWRVLDRFVASQLSTEEHAGRRGLQECKPSGGADGAGDNGDADMATLLLLADGAQEEETGRWLGAGELMNSVADVAADCGRVCMSGDQRAPLPSKSGVEMIYVPVQL